MSVSPKGLCMAWIRLVHYGWHCGIYDAPKDPRHKHFTDPNHPAIAARQSAWNEMTIQQAVHIITATMLIFAIRVWTYLPVSTDTTKLYLALTKAKSLLSTRLGTRHHWSILLITQYRTDYMIMFILFVKLYGMHGAMMLLCLLLLHVVTVMINVKPTNILTNWYG